MERRILSRRIGHVPVEVSWSVLVAVGLATSGVAVGLPRHVPGQGDAVWLASACRPSRGGRASAGGVAGVIRPADLSTYRAGSRGPEHMGRSRRHENAIEKAANRQVARGC